MKKLLLRNAHSILIFSGFMAILATIFSLMPYQINDDAYFDLKAGEIFLRNGILFHDVFSYTAFGREWFPSQWLFQIVIFLVKNSFGFWGIRIFIDLFVLLQISIVYAICKKIFSLNNWLTIIVCIFYFSWAFIYFTARAYLFSNTFFLINLFLLLLFFLKSKKFLFLTLPFTLLWANSHGSIFINIFLFGAYAILAITNFIITKEKAWKNKALILSAYTILTIAITILPPLGLTQYHLAFYLFSKLNLLQGMLDEWMPLVRFQSLFLGLSILNIIMLILFYFINFKQKTLRKSLWILPLICLILFSYSAFRNAFFDYSSLVILLAWILSSLDFKKMLRVKKIILFAILLAFTSLNFIYFYLQALSYRNNFDPQGAVKFIQQNTIKGNMFNEAAYGSYLLYYLYPKEKVFMDIRADVYACCELQDYYSFIIHNKYQPDDQYKISLDKLWKKYNISYVIIDTKENTAQERIGRILVNDPNWSLVFWNDNSQVFVRNDGMNMQLLKNFSTKAVSPYGASPVKGANLDLALKEYEKMVSIADSAHSRNAMGYILLKEGKNDQAENQFTKATQLDNTFESPYMNLGEISLSKGDLQTAIDLYKRSLSLNPARAFIYIRLGQLYLKNNDAQDAKTIWQNGLANIQDQTDQQTFKQLLQTVY